MIKLFEKVIKEHLAKYLAEDNLPLSYLKFSTVTSGSGLNDKVIFLVFKNHASLPFLCLKTVRNYEAKQAILRHFHNFYCYMQKQLILKLFLSGLVLPCTLNAFHFFLSQPSFHGHL